MEANLQVLVVCQDHHSAETVVDEIGELFEGCSPTVCDPPHAFHILRTRSFDVAIVHVESCDDRIPEVVQSMRHLAVDLPIIVSLPPDSSTSEGKLSELKAVHCLTRSNNYPKTVTCVIEEVLRTPVGGSINWIGCKEKPNEQQAAMMRTAAGTLSHEINNPLMAILGISELILKEGKRNNPDVARKVTMIRRSAERIERSLKRLSNITEPSIRPTPAGDIVDVEPELQACKKRESPLTLTNSVDK